MNDSEMIANRYQRHMQNKQLYTRIVDALTNGKRIQITTYTQSKIYSQPSQFRYNKTGVYSQRGKHWDCVNYSSIRFI